MFEKGHAFYPPKDGRQSGTTKAHAQAQRHLAVAVREGISVEALRDYHLLIACGHAAQLYRDPDDGDVSAVCMCCPASEGGHPAGPQSGVIRPTQEERTRSVNWLTDRGHGLPAQSVVIEGVVRGSTPSGLDLASLPPATVFGILALVRGTSSSAGASSSSAPALPEPARGPIAGVIDAACTERATAPAPGSAAPRVVPGDDDE